ncbi:MAG: hypothetical protein R3199_12735 [Gemmatimonadota bacterium]|nr:hypothetical protein [Gemmatimonadota bacterium]
MMMAIPRSATIRPATARRTGTSVLLLLLALCLLPATLSSQEPDFERLWSRDTEG